VISARILAEAKAKGPRAAEAFLRPMVDTIEQRWNAGASAELICSAAAHVRAAIGDDFPPCESSVRLSLVAADATLAAARGTDDAQQAFDLAEAAQSEIVRLPDFRSAHIDDLGKALLISAVALKALGLFEESREHMVLAATDFSLNDLEVLPLRRQAIMMRQDEAEHLRFLVEVERFRRDSPIEYYRCVKRVIEFLLANGRLNAALDLQPEFKRSRSRAGHSIAVGNVSYLKNAAQLLAAEGDLVRARGLLRAIEAIAERHGFTGQLRQIRSLLDSISDGGAMSMPTFSVVDVDDGDRTSAQ
jgi:hypothetical protein